MIVQYFDRSTDSIVYVVVTNQPYLLLSVLFVDILFVFMCLNIQILMEACR